MVELIERMGRLGLGAAPLGNLYRAVTEVDATTVVDEMWDGGVRSFDTAPHYGLGLSETRLGRALADRPRGEFVVSTKVGRLLVPRPDGRAARDDEGFDVESPLQRQWDFSEAGVRRSVDDSRDRLGLEHLDIVYLHDPEDHLDQAVEEALPALVRLREEGVVGAIGVGSKDAAAVARVIRTGSIDLAMLAGRYTLLDRSGALDVLPAATEHGVGVVAVGVYNSGILATSHPGESSTYDYAPADRDVVERARALAAVCAEFDVELPHAALQFPLQHPSVVNVTVGIGAPRHVPSTLRWSSTPLPPELWRRLDASVETATTS